MKRPGPVLSSLWRIIPAVIAETSVRRYGWPVDTLFANENYTPGPSVGCSGERRSLPMRSALALVASIRLMTSKYARAADSRMLVLIPAPR